jgi:hypothetical protein
VVDVFVWGLHHNGQFSVKSLYNALIVDTCVMLMFNKTLWSLKIPLRIKIFTCYFKREVVLTKDNIARHNWEGNRLCAFYANYETIQHLFFYCHFARFI